ncbi:MAG: class I SAM-dependent RNA methyltransferase [Verrucomicrobia bacterium]|nr:class I SAM-dependent RNA methyltransferase [Verrucomicrobiota bacterium]
MITLDIETLSTSGEGIARHEGLVHFVPRALPGERCEAEVVQASKHWRRAHMRWLLTASPDRVEPPCPFYEQCGGCQLQHMTYTKQLEFKRDAVRETLRRVGHIDIEPEPTVASEPFGYRRKITMAVRDQDGALALCLHRWDDPGALVRVERCPLLVDELNAALPTVEAWLNSGDMAWCRPDLRRLVLRMLDDQPVVILACDPVPPRPRYPERVPLPPAVVAAFCTEWLPRSDPRSSRSIAGAEGPEDTGPGREPRDDDGEAVPESRRGDRNRARGGRMSEGAPAYQLGAPTTTLFHPGAFAQANADIAHRLYQAVVERAGEGNATVVDTYCGTGLLAEQLGHRQKNVVAIELDRDAVVAARRRIQAAGLRKRVIVRRGRVEQLLADHLPADLVVLDPPRAGCDARVIRALIEGPPARIAYISCHPAAFARDARRLVDAGYSLERVTPFDMFPQTYHVELLAELHHHPSPASV